jgi:hypothetical protein
MSTASALRPQARYDGARRPRSGGGSSPTAPFKCLVFIVTVTAVLLDYQNVTTCSPRWSRERAGAGLPPVPVDSIM